MLSYIVTLFCHLTSLVFMKYFLLLCSMMPLTPDLTDHTLCDSLPSIHPLDTSMSWTLHFNSHLIIYLSAVLLGGILFDCPQLGSYVYPVGSHY